MYEFVVTIENKGTTPSMIRIKRDFENEWQTKTELANIGTNGLIHTTPNNIKMYYPPHRIVEIEVEEIK